MLPTEKPSALKSLYKQDFVQWIDATVSQLKAKDVEHLDWDNLIEEIEALGKSERRELESRLRVLLAHLLKRCYMPLPDCYRGWIDTIDEQRSELELLLKQSPSLKSYFVEVFDSAFAHALQKVSKDYPDVQFPAEWQFSRTVEAMLSEAFW